MKRILGSFLTWLGIDGLIYATVLIINTSSDGRDIKALIFCSIAGFIFFVGGIGIVRTSKA